MNAIALNSSMFKGAGCPTHSQFPAIGWGRSWTYGVTMCPEISHPIEPPKLLGTVPI
jgi:hypothetical protein